MSNAKPPNPYDFSYPEPRGTPAWREAYRVWRGWFNEEVRRAGGDIEAVMHREGIGHFPCFGTPTAEPD